MAPCLASARPYAAARPLLATARAYLGIENGLHWILGVVFWEDESHVHTRPETYACCDTWCSTCSGRAPPSRPAWPSSTARPTAILTSWRQCCPLPGRLLRDAVCQDAGILK